MTDVLIDYAWAQTSRFAITCGKWDTEAESVAAFDRYIAALGCFNVYTEVRGRYQFLRPAQALKAPRIDRILFPTPRLVEVGWTFGPVGVECKRSGTKTGPALNQLLDYTHAVWKINHTWFLPEWYFLWPVQPTSGPLESILAQHRAGGIYMDERGRLVVHSRGILAKFTPGVMPDIRAYNGVAGTKTGSR